MNTNQAHVTGIVQQRAILFWDLLCDMYPQLAKTPRPYVGLNSRLYRTAGRCCQEQGIIEIGTRFLNHTVAYRNTVLYDTIPHEIVHVADYRLFGPSEYAHGHGKMWHALMIECGLNPNRYHNMTALSRTA